MKTLIHTLLLSCFPLLVWAQSELRIGEWSAFLPYQVGNTVAQDDTYVYYGSVNGLLKIDKVSREVSFFSKVDGLTDVDIRLVRFHEPTNTLIIAYSNSGFDLVSSEGITYIDDIRNTSGIIGSKSINDIYVDETNQIYLSCAFGLVEFNMQTFKFGSTTFTPSPVHDFTKHDGKYYISTDAGLYAFSDFGTQLIANFDAWTRLGTNDGLPADYSSQNLAVYQNVLFAGIGEDLYRYDGDFYLWDNLDGHYIEFISSEGSYLMVGYRCPNFACSGKVYFYNLAGKAGEHGFACNGQPTYTIEDQHGQLWYADEWPGIRVSEQFSSGCEVLSFNAPYSDKVSEIAIQDGVLYVASGGVTDSYNPLGRRDGFFIRDAGQWSFYNHTNTPELNVNVAADYFRIAAHPDSQIIYVGMYNEGLIEYDFETFQIYDKDNSILGQVVGSPNDTRIAGLAFDDAGNLWISNFLAQKPIVVRKADGTWINFSVPRTELAQVVIDQRGYKWFAVITTTEGLLVYDDNGTIDNSSDDRYKYFNTSNSDLPTNLLATLAVDREGDIWVGTREGPVIFDGAQDPFSGDFHGYRVKIDQDGVISYLLFEEEVTAIAIDGANRKWLGTRNGIFVQSPDGETQIAHYNTSNSPLVHNIITDIAIDHSNGDVYIGTEAGINVVRTDAIAGTQIHRSDAYAFPNPVRPGYTGPIAIRGLAEDAIVKITDVSGTLVYETQALGGQAIWNGKDLDGQDAASGVYLVFSTTQSQFDKPDAIVTKILVVR